MLDSAKTKNVIEATNKPHLFEKLEDLQKRFFFFFFLNLTALHLCRLQFDAVSSPFLCFLKRLALCEKALTEYLETKRLEFPRFYFISSADLLDIISKGSRPREVHLDRVLFIFVCNIYPGLQSYYCVSKKK